MLQYKIVNDLTHYATGVVGGRSAAAVAASVEAAVRDGALQAGQRLPPIRQLAVSLALSPATVAAAYRSLARRGLVTTEGRRGTRVTARPPVTGRPDAAVPGGVRNLADGNPDPALLPPLGPVLAGIPVAPRLYEGDPKLPELVGHGRRLLAADGLGAGAAGGIEAGAVAIVGGARDGIERTLQAHLRPGDRVAVEDPAFTGVLDLLAALGLVTEPVAVDDRGMLPDALGAALRGGCQAVIVTPRAHNPTGAALDGDRAAALREVLGTRPEALIVEDDHAGPVAGAPGHTVTDPRQPRWAHVRSVSKWLGPDLRLALLVGDDTTIARVEGRQLLGTGWVSHVLQRVVAALLDDPATAELVARAARTYAARRRALVDALAELGVGAHGRSGTNVWVPVREETATVTALRDAGWAVDAGERYRLRAGPGVRITVSTLLPDEAPALASAIAACVRPAAGRPSA